ncbi:MAG: alpha/beta hydrolase [Acidimicrobiia bacterium]|nr:alpha/beta hydrolase [Acidimicrobiia bacterium]
MARFERLPIYGTEATRAALMAMYDERLQSWPVSFDSSFVSTRLGETHVITTGEPGAPDLLMLPPMGVAGVVWSSIIAALSSRHRVYALDTIGDVGRSELLDPTGYPKNGRQYSAWLDDVCAALGLSSPDLVGGSMGGWIAMHRAIEAPTSVRRLVLLGPMGLPSLRTSTAAIAPMMTYALRPTDARRERILDRALGDGARTNSEFRPWMRLLATCRPNVAAPRSIPSRQLRRIQAPTLVVLGAKDGLVGDANAVARRARHIGSCEIEILSDAGHALSVDEPELVGGRIVQFLSSDA